MSDKVEVEVRELWAIRFGDGDITGAMYSSDDYAEHVVRTAASGTEEVVHRTETITRTPWTAAPASSAAGGADGGAGRG